MSRSSMVWSLSLLGCAPQVGATSDDDATGSAAESSSPSTVDASTRASAESAGSGDAETGIDEGTGMPGSGGYEEDSGGTGCAFTCPPPPTTGGGGGVGPSVECDIAVQDCPELEKCMPWANDGGPLWNATRCSPLDPAPRVPGEACNVEGSGVSGIDDCELGSVCFEVDPKTNEGVCRALCVSTSEPCDGDEGCVTYVPGILGLCIDGCDPLAPTCESGTCAPAADGFICVPGGAQALGDPCTQPDDCIAGSLCISGDLLPECDAVGCCAATCDVEEPDACDVELSCVAWDSDAVPPWDHVGVCIVD